MRRIDDSIEWLLKFKPQFFSINSNVQLRNFAMLKNLKLRIYWCDLMELLMLNFVSRSNYDDYTVKGVVTVWKSLVLVSHTIDTPSWMLQM